MAAQQQAVLPAFEAWMRRAGITWSQDAIELVEAQQGCAGLALAVRAKQDLPEDELLCTIPKSACITTRTARVCDLLEEELLGGGLGLIVAVMAEAALGPDSSWHGYFRGMPGREYLPIFWTPEELALLQGTEIAAQVEQDRQLTASDYQEHVLPLLSKYPRRLPAGRMRLEDFRAASSLVASRAFGIDDYHGMGMVPLADVFNHKASVVDLAPGYVVHGADSSDDDEGEEEEEDEEEDGQGAGGGSGSSGAEEEAAEGGCEGGHGEHCAGQHHHHHHQEQQAQQAQQGIMRPGGQGAHGIHGLTSANGLHLRLEMAIVDGDEELRIVTASTVAEGAEVHNTYGELGNAELVSKYGFALRQNPFTAVALAKAEVVAAAGRGLLGGAAGGRQGGLDRRVALLREETEVLDEEEGEEPFQALPNGHVNFSLFVALRALCASPGGSGRRRCWASVDDALAGPSTAGLEPCGAVQVWPVRAPDGAPLSAEAGAALVRTAAEAVEEAAAAAAPAGAEDGAAAGGSASGGGWEALLTPAMCAALQEAVQARQRQYPASLRADLAKLAALDSGAGGGGGDHGAAVRAALTLRVTEQEVLADLQEAVVRRLAHLGAADAGGAKQAGKTQTAAKRQQQQQQQQQQQPASGAAPPRRGKRLRS